MACRAEARINNRIARLRTGCYGAPAFARFGVASEGWRNAVDLRHTPVSRSALFSKQARSARPVDIPKWCPRQDLHLHCRRFELRASALGYTGVRMVLPVRFALTLHGV